jgi:hypothetical protein
VNNFRQKLYETALSAGIQIISGDKCCQLLSYLYVYGGENEQMTMDGRINSAMLYAQKRLNILGGEIPDVDLLPVLQDYIKSITDYDKPPEWVLDLEREYGIKPHRGKK